MTKLFILFSLLVNPYARDGISLDGVWSAIIDQFDIGAKKKLWLDREVSDKSEILEYSWNGGLTLNVPGDWNHQDPGLWWYEGTVWYARHFQAEREEGKRRILYFAGVNVRCEVWLNGIKVASHEGAFTPFQVDVTEVLKDGDNFLAVRVNNNRRSDVIPAMNFDWWNYGGITREVMLLSVPNRHIEDYFIRLQPGSSDRILVDVCLSSAVSGQDVWVEIPELKWKVRLTSGPDGTASGSFRVKKIGLWNPLAPKLYDIRVSSAEDVVVDRIGFRNIAVEGTRILVNGDPVFIKSISFHEEIPMEKRRAVSESDARILVDASLELGCNTIRLAHYPQSEHIVRYAEEKGLLIWEEVPLWQGIDFSNQETYLRAETYLREMIERDRNRCAIGFWSISNETKPAADRDAFLSRLLSYGRSLDSSRLFTSAFDIAHYVPEADEFQMKDDFAGELDVIGINKYMGWYTKWPKPAAEIGWNVFPDKPLIISEFGCEAVAGHFGDSDVANSWSEDYQVSLFRDNLAMFGNIPNLAGISPWLLYDFLSPRRQHPTKQSFFNRKGLLSDKRCRKKAWYLMKEYYAEAGYRDLMTRLQGAPPAGL